MKTLYTKQIIVLSFTILLCFKTSVIMSQCAAGGTLTPVSVTNNSSVGSVGWLGMANAQASDNAYVSSISALGILGSAQSNYMNTTGYGFAIPSSASICGIKVEIERNAAGLLIGSSIKDKSLSMMKSGALAGSDYASSTNWTGSDVVVSYGGSSDTWGTTWTPADVNAANFGVAISTEMKAGLAALLLTSNIDKVAITVYYNTIVLPLETVSFTGVAEQHAVKLEWKTASEVNNQYFALEKMNAEYGWDVLKELVGAGNSTTEKKYKVYDTNPSELNYYRVKQVDFDHNVSYSDILSVEYSTTKENGLILYPLPVSQVLSIQTTSKIEKVEIISDKGTITVPEISFNQDVDVDVSSLSPGLYTMKVYTSGDVKIKRFIKE